MRMRPGRIGTTMPTRPMSITSPASIVTRVSLTASIMASPRRLGPDHVQAAHPGPQHLGNDDGAIGLLVVLENGDQRPRERQPRAVERVHHFGVGARAAAEAGAASLEVAAVRNRRDFQPLAATRSPGLHVIGLAGGEAQITGAESLYSVGKAQLRTGRLGV